MPSLRERDQVWRIKLITTVTFTYPIARKITCAYVYNFWNCKSRWQTVERRCFSLDSFEWNTRDYQWTYQSALNVLVLIHLQVYFLFDRCYHFQPSSRMTIGSNEMRDVDGCVHPDAERCIPHHIRSIGNTSTFSTVCNSCMIAIRFSFSTGSTHFQIKKEIHLHSFESIEYAKQSNKRWSQSPKMFHRQLKRKM
jgi:hypothetical protein